MGKTLIMSSKVKLLAILAESWNEKGCP